MNQIQQLFPASKSMKKLIRIEAISGIYTAIETCEADISVQRLKSIRTAYKASRKLKLRQLLELFLPPENERQFMHPSVVMGAELKARREFKLDDKNHLRVTITQL